MVSLNQKRFYRITFIQSNDLHIPFYSYDSDTGSIIGEEEGTPKDT